MDAKENDDKTVNFVLSRNEALVFFDWLGRFTSEAEQGNLVGSVDGQILFDFEACLEKILVEPFKDNYAELVERARQDLRSKDF